jgi:ABC-type bacteriocin/lantibiotic exporter with double-glycine peptidase domain
MEASVSDLDDSGRLLQAERTDRSQRSSLDAELKRAARPISSIAAPLTTQRSDAAGLDRVVEVLARHTSATAPAASEASRRRSGTDPIAALAAAGMRARPVTLAVDWWREPGLAMLGEFDGAPVALLRGRRGCEAHDASGTTTRIGESTAVQVGAEAWEVYAQLPTDRAATTRDLLRIAVAGERRGLRLVLSCAVIAAALGLVTPAITGWVLGTLVPLGRTTVVVAVGVVLMQAAITSALLLVVQQRALSGMEQGAQMRAQTAVWDRVLSMPSPFFRRFSPGDLSVRVTAAQQMVNLVSASLVSQVLGAVLALANVFVMLSYDITLGLIGAGAFAATVGVLALVLRAAAPIASSMVESQLEITARSVETVTGITTIRDGAAEPRAMARMLGRITDYTVAQATMTRLSGVFATTVGAGASLATALFVAGTMIWGWGPDGPAIDEAQYIGFATAFGAAYGGITALVVAVMPLMMVRPLLGLAEPILREIPERTTGREPWAPRGAVELKGVTFRYSPDSPDVLHRFVLVVDPGEMLAVVGPSGSGKSTILRLILGFETADEGQVLIDGREIGDLDVAVLRSEMGAVTQDATLPGSSIRDTVAGQRRLDDDEIWGALDHAAIGDDVRAMPMQLETAVTPVTVSGGQQQRLLLARALARSANLLLLDEATSAMDDVSQAIVMESLMQLDATRIIVAHRLSTVRAADRIVVIDGGRIAESGTYDALVAQGGLFARLVARQLV